MKYMIILFVLAFFAAQCNSAAIQSGTRANMSIGWLRPGDVLLKRANVSLPAIPNVIQYQDYVYRGSIRTFISAVTAFESGWSQYGVAYAVAGGIGQSNVTIRLQSARGYGFNYTIDIYGSH